ncbi:hypothetical protein D3C72_2127110 [compost metagenome]
MSACMASLALSESRLRKASSTSKCLCLELASSRLGTSAWKRLKSGPMMTHMFSRVLATTGMRAAEINPKWNSLLSNAACL